MSPPTGVTTLIGSKTYICVRIGELRNSMTLAKFEGNRYNIVTLVRLKFHNLHLYGCLCLFASLSLPFILPPVTYTTKQQHK